MADDRHSKALASPAWLWALFCATLAAAGVLLWHTWDRVQLAERPPAAVDPRAAGTATKASAMLSLAGSGSNLPLTRRLLDAFAKDRPGAMFVLHDSIGSSGGVRAVRDGAVDIGLISRGLKPKEPGDLQIIPYARTEVVLVAHPSVPEQELDQASLLELFAGRKSAFGNSRSAVVFLREPGDSSHAALERAWPEFAASCRAAHAERRFRVLFSDQALLRAVADTPGAVGLSDRGQVRLFAPGLRMVEMRSGRGREAAPVTKDLAFVVRPEPSDAVRKFLDFVFSDEGRRVIEDAGYFFLAPGARPWE
ncbi:MAG: hypothetical protein GYA21_09235 [Myxococcales bacterium]|nr:hypothetical protein [Myxococcales bacterium]